MDLLLAARPSLPVWLQAALVVAGAFGLGALLVTGPNWRKLTAEATVRPLAGGLLAALVAGAFIGGGGAGGALGVVGGPGAGTAGTQGGTAATAPGSQPGAATSTGAAGGTALSGSSAPLTGSAASSQLPPLKIGYVGLNPNGASSVITAFVPNYPKPQDPSIYANAVQNYVNTHGGVNGRRIEIVTVQRDPNSTDPNQYTTLCKQLTEGDHVFAVVNTDTDTDSDACYAQHHTPMICDCGIDVGDIAQDKPWLWAPGSSNDEQGWLAQYEGLGMEGFYASGSKLGILIDDTPEIHQIYNQKIAPMIARYHQYASGGIEVYNIKDAQSTADWGQLSSDTQNAVTQFELDGVNRVTFMYSGNLVPLEFLGDAEKQHYFPTYGFNSSAQPFLTMQADAPGDQLVNSVGTGTAEIVDVDSAHAEAYPTGPELPCYQAFKAIGDQASTRVGSAYEEELCDGVYMFVAAAQGLGQQFLPQQWTYAANYLGTRFQAAVGLLGSTRFIPNRFNGIDAFRELKYTLNCSGDPDANPQNGGCYVYTSGNIAMPE